MFKLKQKTKTASLSLALAAAMTGGVMMGTSTSVQAINIAQDGIGEVLVFPYYTVRGGWQSYFNLTNTSDRTIIVKIRWQEGVNSRDARDFNIALSPFDVWTGAVIPDPDGEGARVVSSDKSCTAPSLANEPTDRSPNLKGIDFTNLAYAGDNWDGGSESLGRTKEGYVTVFVMGVAKKENNDIIDPPTAALPDGLVLTVAEAAKHSTVVGNNNEGVPANCGFIVNEFIKFVDGKENLFQDKKIFNEQLNGSVLEGGEFHEPNNVLRGRAVLINPASGIAMGYDPTVLANFVNPTELGKYAGMDSDDPSNIIFAPASQQPNLDNTNPAIASWIDDTPGASVQLQTVSASEAAASFSIGSGRAIDAVSVLFNRVAIVNDYNVAGESKTDWVVTLPTKRYYVDDGGRTGSAEFAALPSGLAPIAPFDSSVNGEAFDARLTGESCFDVSMRIWDREEGELTVAGGLDFSPKPPPGQANQFCYETNIISFGQAMNTFVDDVSGVEKPLSNVMGSQLSKAFETTAGAYGWAQLEFSKSGGAALPVIGVRLETRKQEGNPSASYGFANAHSYKRDLDAYSETPNWETEFDRSNPEF